MKIESKKEIGATLSMSIKSSLLCGQIKGAVGSISRDPPFIYLFQGTLHLFIYFKGPSIYLFHNDTLETFI